MAKKYSPPKCSSVTSFARYALSSCLIRALMEMNYSVPSTFSKLLVAVAQG